MPVTYSQGLNGAVQYVGGHHKRNHWHVVELMHCCLSACTVKLYAMHSLQYTYAV